MLLDLRSRLERIKNFERKVSASKNENSGNLPPPRPLQLTIAFWIKITRAHSIERLPWEEHKDSFSGRVILNVLVTLRRFECFYASGGEILSEWFYRQTSPHIRQLIMIVSIRRGCCRRRWRLTTESQPNYQLVGLCCKSQLDEMRTMNWTNNSSRVIKALTMMLTFDKPSNSFHNELP